METDNKINTNFKNKPVLIKCIECDVKIHFSLINGICNKCIIKLLFPPTKIYNLYRASKGLSKLIDNLYKDITIKDYVKIISNLLHYYFNFQRITIFAYEPDKEQLRGFCSNEVPQEYLFSLILPTEKKPETDYRHKDLAVLSFQENEIKIINDRTQEPGYKKYLNDIKNNIPVKKKYAKSFMMVPLFTRFEKVGVLGLYRTEGKFYKKISYSESKIIRIIAHQVASTIDIFFPQFYNKMYAITDGLTRLYNRRYFDNRLKEELILANRKKLSVGLLMIDIDKFKDFNDKFGHQTGDDVLKQVSDTIKKYTRSNDIVCRYGGEEFAVIVTNTNLKHAKLVAERIRKGIQKISEYNITISIGISSFPEIINIPSPEKIIKSSDEHLYKAKNSGRNCIKSDLD